MVSKAFAIMAEQNGEFDLAPGMRGFVDDEVSDNVRCS
jgi:hypothetical protein